MEESDPHSLRREPHPRGGGSEARANDEVSRYMPEGNVLDTVARRTFSLADQTRFGSLSGDVNPMHVDPVEARRTQAGAVCVHGIYAALWALDAYLRQHPDIRRVGSLRAKFASFVYLDEEVSVGAASRSANHLSLDLFSAGMKVAALSFKLEAPSPATASLDVANGLQVDGDLRAPLEHEPADVATLRGYLAYASDPAGVAATFPHVAATIGNVRVASLAALSKLSGMVCPGLHSITSTIDVAFVEGGEAARGIRFATSKFDARYRLAYIDVDGGGIAGHIESFVRQPPVRQAALTALRNAVNGDEFAGSTPLVIGASRGLGELTAKLLVAGGAQPTLTYATGLADAERVAAEIAAYGGVCRVRHFDARDAAGTQLRDVTATHVYYFATPRISRQRAALYAPALALEFLQFYATAFFDVCEAFAAKAPFAAFYPSTRDVEEPARNVTEYAMAKAAGERLCAEIDRFMPGARVRTERLPRMLTDQTATVLPQRLPAAVDVMLPVVRSVQQL